MAKSVRKSRLHTLRGSIPAVMGDAATFGAPLESEIFSYQSVDTSRAWRLKEAWVWTTNFTGVNGGDSRGLLQACLTTDAISPRRTVSQSGTRKYLQQYNPSDNRTIAWCSQDLLVRDNTNADWIVQDGGEMIPFLIDEDRLITRRLDLNTFLCSEGPDFDDDFFINYYIVLEETKVSVEQNVLQQLKGSGQDIES